MSLPNDPINKDVANKHREVSKQDFFNSINTDFYGWVEKKSKETGKPKDDIVAEIFGNSFLTVEEVCQEIQESEGGGAVGSAMVTVHATPKVIDDLDELRRLRNEFAPVSKATDYILSMILGNKIDIIIDDPTDSNQVDSKKRIQRFANNIYQDTITLSLYSLMRIMLNKALTDGFSVAEIRYEKPVRFMDYVDEIDQSVKSKSILFNTREPNWQELGGIVQLKILENAPRRLKVYKNPITWDFNYITLDEVLNDDMANDLKGLQKATTGGVSTTATVRYHPWQVFWLAVNRTDGSERGTSVIAPVKKIALILEKVIQAVGESAYRNANKKYALVMGDDKHTIGKPQVRTVLQLFNEMGKRGWSAIPVPAGFDIKEFGQTAFDASNVINSLLIMIAEGMHVPVDVLGITKAGNEGSKIQSTTTFNEIEQMRYEFKQAIINQLFKRQLYCELGKTKTKQGGKGVSPIYVPDISTSTKGLLSPIDEIETIKSLFNSANPLTPELKYELERRLAKLMNVDTIKFKDPEEYSKQVKEEQEMAIKLKRLQLEQAEINVKRLKKNLEAPAMPKTDGDSGSPPPKEINMSPEKRQGQPEPPSREKQLKRLENGVSRKKEGSNVGKVKERGSTRVPKIVSETWCRELEDNEHRSRRVRMINEAKLNGITLTHEDVDKVFISESYFKEEPEIEIESVEEEPEEELVEEETVSE